MFPNPVADPSHSIIEYITVTYKGRLAWFGLSPSAFDRDLKISSIGNS